MIKTLIVKETERNIILKVQITRPATLIDRVKVALGAIEVARFNKSGMGYCALGAAGRMITKSMTLDHIEFHGSRELYMRLVHLEVIDPKLMNATTE